MKIKETAYHRNGISGEGFFVILFDWYDVDGDITRKMMATVFDKPGQCAVFDVDQLGKGNIEFANGNSWRGDHFEKELRQAIKEWKLEAK